MKVSYYTSEIRQSLPSDYKNIDDRMIIRLMNEYRSVYVKNEYNKNKTIDKYLTQDIPVELMVADQSTMDFISTSDRILVSTLAIPKILKISDRELVTSIRNPKILSQDYNYVTRNDAVFAGNGRFNKKDIYIFIDNNRLYVKLKKENPNIAMLTFINLQAIFEDPLKCKDFQYTGYLDDMDYEYPMTDYIWGYIKSSMLKESFGVVQSNTEDRLQDGTERKG